VNLALAIAIGGVYATALYLMMRRNPVKLIIGLALLSQGANLLIFAAAGLVRAKPPLIELESAVPTGEIADPLPQALILTAIVIGFAVQAFLLTMLVVTWRRTRSLDVNDLAIEEH
jgi:multicomponent Na+:H+ antiporter subunit C